MINFFFRRKKEDWDKNEVRGQYFSKKKYDQKSIFLPEFKESQKVLPKPILENNPELVEMYWGCFKVAFEHLKKVSKGSPLISDYIDEGFSDNIFLWDSALMMLFWRYGYKAFPAINSLDNFYARQYKSGYICREINEHSGKDFVFENRSDTIAPPLLAFAEIEYFKVSGNKKRLEKVLASLEKYASFIDRPGNIKLAQSKNWQNYGRRAMRSKHKLFWNTNLGSGMDNLKRLGTGWVDMSSQMVLLFKNLAFICEQLGFLKRANVYKQRAKELTAEINKWCFNESDGFYYDVDKYGRQLKKKTIAGFWPLLAKIPNKKQAQKLISHLKDENEFFRPFLFPALAKSEKDYKENGNYWQGGVWAPTNYMVVKGLKNYGYFDLANKMSEKYLNAVCKVFEKTHTFWENYAPEKFAPGKPAKKDFVGWTGLGPIAMLIENILGFKADADKKSLTWHIQRSDRHGIENLAFGDFLVNAVFEPRGKTIEFLANASLDLIVFYKMKKYRFRVGKGKQEILRVR